MNYLRFGKKIGVETVEEHSTYPQKSIRIFIHTYRPLRFGKTKFRISQAFKMAVSA